MKTPTAHDNENAITKQKQITKDVKVNTFVSNYTPSHRLWRKYSQIIIITIIIIRSSSSGCSTSIIIIIITETKFM